MKGCGWGDVSLTKQNKLPCFIDRCTKVLSIKSKSVSYAHHFEGKKKNTDLYSHQPTSRIWSSIRVYHIQHTILHYSLITICEHENVYSIKWDYLTLTIPTPIIISGQSKAVISMFTPPCGGHCMAVVCRGPNWVLHDLIAETFIQYIMYNPFYGCGWKCFNSSGLQGKSAKSWKNEWNHVYNMVG